MEPIIDLAPGAEDSPLAAEFARQIRNNLTEKPEKLRDFRALRGPVYVVAQDEGDSFTLRFDHGRLTVHEGQIGIPFVTFCADKEALLMLRELPLNRWLKAPMPFSLRGSSRQLVRDLGGRLARGELRIYGLAAHPRMVLRLLRILSRS